MQNNLKGRVRHFFMKRDKAVGECDADSFLDTQPIAIEGSSSFGYLELDSLASKVIAVHQDEAHPNLIVVLVKEQYHKDGKLSHEGYLLYYLVVDKTQKISVQNIAWARQDGT